MNATCVWLESQKKFSPQPVSSYLTIVNITLTIGIPLNNYLSTGLAIVTESAAYTRRDATRHPRLISKIAVLSAYLPPAMCVYTFYSVSCKVLSGKVRREVPYCW